MPCQNIDIKNKIIKATDRWIQVAKENDYNIIIMGDFNESDKGKISDNTYIKTLDKSHLLDIHKILARDKTINTLINGL